MVIYEPFWNTLQKSGLSTYTLINKYHISSSLVHRLRHNLPISTVTISDLCAILQCNVEDIIKYIPDDEIKEL